jgi:FkbM family methyltransferase
MSVHPRPITAVEIKELVGPCPLMLEIGSHDGRDTASFLREMPGIDLHCFEPEVRAVKRFRSRISPTARVTLFEVAVSDVDGVQQFYASTGNIGKFGDWDYSGSLQRPTGHFTRSPEIKFKEPILVSCICLDTWYELYRHTRSRHELVVDFIWADVQGSQRRVIEGGKRTLARTRYLYIESHEPVAYDNEPTQSELVKELSEWFEPIAVYARENILFERRLSR